MKDLGAFQIFQALLSHTYLSYMWVH